MTVPVTVGTDARPHQSTRPRARAGLLLLRHVILTMAWPTLIGGCAAGTALLSLLAYFAGTSHNPLDQTTVRLTLLPAVAAVTFIPNPPLRSLARSAPLPAWIVPAVQVILAAPALVWPCGIQVIVMSHPPPVAARHHLAAIYPVIAQLTGWAAVAVAI